MTQEEKQLLLVVLCARLPYNFTYCYCNAPLAEGRPIVLTPVVISNLMNATDDLVLKPYLRPMSSMTKEERDEYESYLFTIKKDSRNCIYHTCEMVEVEETHNLIDWLNKKQFDYRGLIPMGLAIEAPEGMYKK